MIKRNLVCRRTAQAIVVAMLLVWPPMLIGPYYLRILTLSALYVIVALGFNYILGMTGQFSVCQAAFWGIGAYYSALLSTRLHFSFWIAFPTAGIAVALLAALLGSIVVRWKGHYLAMITLGLGVITTQVLGGWVAVTEGPIGIRNIPAPEPIRVLDLMTLNFASSSGYYYLAFVSAALTLAVATRIRDSRVGDALSAIRDDEVAAEVAGINTYRFKLLAFILSGLFAGLGGSLYAHYSGIIVPTMSDLPETMKMLLMVTMGGNDPVGVVAAAVLVTFLPEWFRVLDQYRTMLYGAALILTLVFLPKGLPEGGRILLRSGKKFLNRLRANNGWRTADDAGHS